MSIDPGTLKSLGAHMGFTTSAHPRYPGMGLRQILAVRELEQSGMQHEEALKCVMAASRRTVPARTETVAR